MLIWEQKNLDNAEDIKISNTITDISAEQREEEVALKTIVGRKIRQENEWEQKQKMRQIRKTEKEW